MFGLGLLGAAAYYARDLLRQLIGIARFRDVPPEMTPDLLDAACGTYFVNASKRK